MSRLSRLVSLLCLLARWLVLALTVWLAYGLLRGLVTVIYLGVAFYDWQWYLAVIALVVGLPVWIVLRWPDTRRGIVVVAGLLLWAAVGYNGFGHKVDLRPGQRASPPISFWAFSDLDRVPDSLLRDLGAAGGAIYLSTPPVPYEGNGARALADGLRRLSDNQIDVYLAPAISDFLSAPVYGEWITSTDQALAFIQSQRLPHVRGVIGDVEMPLNSRLDILHQKQREFCEAAAGLRDGVTRLHSSYPGLEIGITASWVHYLDRLDGDSDLSILMRSPADPPGGWDFASVMTYSSYFPRDWHAYYVYTIERAMTRRFPDAPPAHLIGIAGGGFPGELVLDFDDLVRDAQISRALGVPEIVVFQLDGALNMFGDDFVQRFTRAVKDVPPEFTVSVPFSRPASVMVYGTAVADALLDIFRLGELLSCLVQ